METTEMTPIADHTPMSELASYHSKLIEKHQNIDLSPALPNAEELALMQFNGYYSLNLLSPGAFFAVDTNVVVTSGKAPVNDLALLISLDGKTSQRFALEGTFENNVLTQGMESGDGLYVKLTFFRSENGESTTATCSGTIRLPNQEEVQVSGMTYNNPIPVSLFTGNYFALKDPTHPVVQIQSKGGLLYDDNSGSGLQPVASYCYNMNMYFFSFDMAETNESVRLIMGSSLTGGLVCSCMAIDNDSKSVSSLSLQMITSPNEQPFGFPNLNSRALAKFSGYYQINSSPGAFVCIQGQYVNAIGDDYVVLIGVSLDGVISNGYYFEESKMSFENNVLSIPEHSITLTFKKEYNASTGSLASLNGNIGSKTITGETLFNPVPLSAFGGATMTDQNGLAMSIVSDNELIFSGKNFATTMTNILYVPVMYILAYPAENPTIVLSFGTDGLHGNTCIVTDNNSIQTVYAIPS